MGDERDMFAGLGWDKEIRSIANLHIPVNLSPEFEFVVGNRSSDNYDLTPFSQSTQAWRWRTREEQKQREKKEKKQDHVLEKDADVDEDNTNETEEDEVKVEGKSSKSISFRKRMRALLPHHLPLKDRKRDKTVSYMDLLKPGPPPSDSSKKYAKRK
jgi:hypothetical protein